jgi:hypothetical protein
MTNYDLRDLKGSVSVITYFSAMFCMLLRVMHTGFLKLINSSLLGPCLRAPHRDLIGNESTPAQKSLKSRREVKYPN